MLTCDAFGVLPPISRLTPAQAMYHFLSGYTAQVAGTEKGLGAEPKATFSTCFAPPVPAAPAGGLRPAAGRPDGPARRQCWLVNTGWSGGQYGVGKRMSIRPHPGSAARRAGRHAAELHGSGKEPFFGLSIPEQVPGMPGRSARPPSVLGRQSRLRRDGETPRRAVRGELRRVRGRGRRRRPSRGDPGRGVSGDGGASGSAIPGVGGRRALGPPEGPRGFRHQPHHRALSRRPVAAGTSGAVGATIDVVVLARPGSDPAMPREGSNDHAPLDVAAQPMRSDPCAISVSSPVTVPPSPCNTATVAPPPDPDGSNASSASPAWSCTVK